MTAAFKAAMAKLAVVGQDTSKMVDCSEVIPSTFSDEGLKFRFWSFCIVPPPLPAGVVPMFPAGLSNKDIEQAVSYLITFLSNIFCNRIPVLQCASAPFPTLPTAPGPATSVAPV